jgi:pimeloyl-ACP methyl ester carboxylesterase
MSKLLRILSAATAGAGILTYARFRRELADVRGGVDAGSIIAETTAGPIEYAERGKGDPMLVIHGAGGGYDQALLLGRDIGEGYRVIAPSRFGYLKTPVPDDSSPAAQADAHAALIDFLGIKKTIVVAASAGAPSAIELALRHPERVSALILLVPRTYHPTQSIGADESVPSQAVLRLVKASADFLFWIAMRVSRGSVVRFLGVPPEVEANASQEECARVTELMNSIRPLSSRVRGIEVDSRTQMSPWPLERLVVPTLIVSAEDDLYKTLPGARFTAERIKGAEMRVLKSGGHLMVGQRTRVRKWVGDLLRRNRMGRPKDKKGVEESRRMQLERV